MKYCEDGSFLSDGPLKGLRESILGEFRGMSLQREGKFCGFVWFVIPKIIINQKYRIRHLSTQAKSKEFAT
jgi:hypothetical protein